MNQPNLIRLVNLESFLHHFLIGFALVVFFVLDVFFVEFSNTPLAAFTFAIISFLILASLAIFAGGFDVEPEESSVSLIAWLAPDPVGSIARSLIAAAIPGIVVVVFTFLPELENLIINDEALQITFVFSLFWILASLALTGVVLGFIWPRTGLFEAVLAGTLVVLVQGLVTWARVGPPWEVMQLALFNLMIWVSICLAGAWVGVALREFGDTRFYGLVDDDLDEDNASVVTAEAAEDSGQEPDIN